MPNFEYIALDSRGQETTGTLSAPNEAEAYQMLRREGLYPTKVGEAGKGGVGATAKRKATKAAKGGGKKKGGKPAKVTGKIKPKILMLFTRQLATLVDAGLPLLKGLSVLGEQERNKIMNSAIHTMADSVQTGSTFSESLGQHPKIFNKLYVNMVKAGELGGVLEVVLNRLAEYQEKAEKLKNKVVAAMVYPIIGWPRDRGRYHGDRRRHPHLPPRVHRPPVPEDLRRNVARQAIARHHPVRHQCE
jgi:type IV pilus assembly protein PilC